MFQLGVIGDFNLSKSLYFRTGFLYSQKGFKMDFLGVEIKVPISYFEVPMNLVYKHDLGGTKLFVLGGAYIGYGLSAKVKSGDDEEEIEFGSNDDQLKRIDAGLNFGTGIEFQKIQLGINYELGIIDLENLEEATLKNRVFSISVAYLFRKAKELIPIRIRIKASLLKGCLFTSNGFLAISNDYIKTFRNPWIRNYSYGGISINNWTDLLISVNARLFIQHQILTH